MSYTCCLYLSWERTPLGKLLPSKNIFKILISIYEWIKITREVCNRCIFLTFRSHFSWRSPLWRSCKYHLCRHLGFVTFWVEQATCLKSACTPETITFYKYYLPRLIAVTLGRAELQWGNAPRTWSLNPLCLNTPRDPAAWSLSRAPCGSSFPSRSL